MAKINSTIDLLEAGIKAESLRQKTIANNIANLETPNYRSLDVKFEDLLVKALNSPTADDSEIEPEIYRPETTPLKENGNDVNLEAQVGQMVKNTLRHTTYVRLLTKQYQQIQLAMDLTR